MQCETPRQSMHRLHAYANKLDTPIRSTDFVPDIEHWERKSMQLYVEEEGLSCETLPEYV